MNIKISHLLIALVVISSIGLFGCGSRDSDKEACPDFMVADGRFYACDIGQAQSHMCFNLLLPDYLPPNIDIGPVIEGLLVDDCANSEVEVQVRYQTSGKTIKGLLLLEEGNYSRAQSTPDNTFYVAQTLVAEHQEAEISVPADGTIDHLAGFEFHWQQNGVYFTVGVYGYNRENAVRIIESMVK